jgi:large subunit ribosomal protein L10
MDNPRPEKVAVVDEVRSRLEGSGGTILTEYRGLTVSEMAVLRQALEKAGGDYKVYKNTLVKLAITGGRHQPLEGLLEGPTAIAFVDGEISAVAKALRDYARTNPNLVIKGGMFGGDVLSTADLGALADLPSRDVLLSRLAGGLAAPLRQMAGLLQALPRNFAYGLQALVDKSPDSGGALDDKSPDSGGALDDKSPDSGGALDDTDAGAGAQAAEATGESPAQDSEEAKEQTENG